MPKVFISYSWEDDDHKEWVRSFADSLLKNGIDATLDQYDLSLGDRLPHFMEQSIMDSDYVLIICTPTYKIKSDNRSGGVGYEGHIISGELLTTGNERKFIPIIRKGAVETSMPNFLFGKYGVDLSSDDCYEINFNDLLTTLLGKKKKPLVNHNVNKKNNEHVLNQTDKEEPIHILGIITDKVTVPKMDGSRGCALYRIPFQLSRKPSSLWVNRFINAWNHPTSFSSMHRPGIASVVSDTIVLDGTTIEEVKDTHREMLIKCVERANLEEKEIIEKEKLKKEKEMLRKEEHISSVIKVADEIEF